MLLLINNKYKDTYNFVYLNTFTRNFNTRLVQYQSLIEYLIINHLMRLIYFIKMAINI